MFSIFLILVLNLNFGQEISELSTKIKYEIIYDEISTFGYDTVINKINKSKEVQEQHSRFLSYMKAKSEDKKSRIAMQIRNADIRKKYGKRIDFSGYVYKILYSYNDIPNGIRACDCAYCILNKDNAGEIIASAKPRVKIAGDSYDVIEIYAPYGGYEHFLKVSKSKIVSLAKKLGFSYIEYFVFEEHYKLKL